AQLANLVNAAIRSRVNLNHVQRRPRRNLLARIALAARLGRRPVHAVQRLGQDARRRGFPHAARSRKNVRVRHAIRFDRVGQRFRDVALPHQIRKRLRPPFSRNHLVSHTCLGALPFAVIAKGGFIFGVRPEKVKTLCSAVPQLRDHFCDATTPWRTRRIVILRAASERLEGSHPNVFGKSVRERASMWDRQATVLLKTKTCHLKLSSQFEELRDLRGTLGLPGTVAPFRAWRGSRDLVAQSPKFHASAVALFASAIHSLAHPSMSSNFPYRAI